MSPTRILTYAHAYLGRCTTSASVHRDPISRTGDTAYQDRGARLEFAEATSTSAASPVGNTARVLLSLHGAFPPYRWLAARASRMPVPSLGLVAVVIASARTSAVPRASATYRYFT